MSIYSMFNNPFDPHPLFGQRSIYVISDSEMARYKRAQIEAEVAELERLKQDNLERIERLDKTIALLKKDLPALPEEAVEPKAE